MGRFKPGCINIFPRFGIDAGRIKEIEFRGREGWQKFIVKLGAAIGKH